MARKVAIVGRAATAALAPWDDTSWEIWGLPWVRGRRADRLFDVHSQALWSEKPEAFWYEEQWLPEYREMYGDTPVYCHPSRCDKFINAVVYPFDEIIASMPIPYLENTIAYELALAIHEGVDEVGLWGVHMVSRLEFVWERPSVTFLIGIAIGKGIKVTIAPGAPLFLSAYVAGRYGEAGGMRDMSIVTGAPDNVVQASRKSREGAKAA